jgi:hypothetical protein
VAAFRLAGCPEDRNYKNRYKADDRENSQGIAPEPKSLTA